MPRRRLTGGLYAEAQAFGWAFLYDSRIWRAFKQGYDAYIRVDGDLDSLKRFIAAGYPVLVEKGFTCQPGERCTGWFGHYSVFTGYDDDKRHFITQDTFVGPNLKLSYDDVLENWRAFNYLYLVIFPAGAEREAIHYGLARAWSQQGDVSGRRQ